MTQDESLLEIEKLNILNKHVLDVASNKKYKIVHVSSSKELDNDSYCIQVAMTELINQISDLTRVEKYETIRDNFEFI